MNHLPTRYYAIIPAAGSGSRFTSALPKQYNRIGDKTVLEWSIQPFLDAEWILNVVAVLSATDHYFAELSLADHPKIITVVGGVERQDSVMAGLMALDNIAQAHDYILVHDAARPNLHRFDLMRLVDELQEHSVGGLLCSPVVDSIKRIQDGRVIDSVSREQLYRALTPQMFRYGLLLESLRSHYPVTDEATAVQLAGHPVQMVHGRSDNIKVTVPQNLAIAKALLLEPTADSGD